MLDGPELTYYEDAQKTIRKGSLTLDQDASARICKTFLRTSWQINVTALQKHMIIELDSEEERDKWLLAINAAIRRVLDELNIDEAEDNDFFGQTFCADDIKFRGWLNKKGAKIKSWRNRFVVLTNRGLFYFEDSSMQCPKGSVIFDKSVRLYTTEVSEAQNCKFCVSTIARTLELSAQSIELRGEWLYHCSDIVNRVASLTHFIAVVDTDVDFRYLRSWERSIFAEDTEQYESAKHELDSTGQGAVGDQGALHYSFVPYKGWMKVFDSSKLKQEELAEAKKKDKGRKAEAVTAVTEAEAVGKSGDTKLRNGPRKKSSLDRIRDKIVSNLIHDITQSSTRKVSKLIVQGLYELISLCCYGLAKSGEFKADTSKIDSSPEIPDLHIPTEAREDVIRSLNALGALILTYRFEEPSFYSRIKFSRLLAVNRLELSLKSAMSCLESVEEKIFNKTLSHTEEESLKKKIIHSTAKRIADHNHEVMIHKSTVRGVGSTAINEAIEDVTKGSDVSTVLTDLVINTPSDYLCSVVPSKSDLMSTCQQSPTVSASALSLQRIMRSLFANSIKGNLSFDFSSLLRPSSSSSSFAGSNDLGEELIAVFEEAIKTFVSSKLQLIEDLLVKYISDLVEMIAEESAHSISNETVDGALLLTEEKGKDFVARAASKATLQKPLQKYILERADTSWADLLSSVEACIGGGLQVLRGYGEKKSENDDCGSGDEEEDLGIEDKN